MTQPQVAIGITADDKTAKGWSSAEKRAGRAVGKIGSTNRDGLKDAQDGITRSSKGIVKAFSAIEQAGSRALSGGSMIGRAGALREVGLLGRGMGAAAAEGIGLEGAMVGVAGAAVGVAAAAVVAGGAMWKLADGWGKGANKLGNMASLIGVSTRGLQEFAGAAERAGVDKDTATGTLGSLSQTLNDARYGRNNTALAILGKMGVKLQTNQDGTVNVEAMLPAIATALAAQNSSGRRTAGHALGIADAAMPAFTQGGKGLSADMADYGRNGAMMTDADTKLGHDLTRRDTIGAQRLGKAWLGAQRWNATAVKDVGDAVIGAASGKGLDLGSQSPIGTASAQERPFNTHRWDAPLGRGDSPWLGRGSGMPWRAGGKMDRAAVLRHARHSHQEYLRQIARGKSPEEAAALASASEAESGNNFLTVQSRGPGRGKYQWGSNEPKADRRRVFRRVIGTPIEQSTNDQQDRFADWEFSHTHQRAKRKIDEAQTAGDKSAAMTRYYEAPKYLARDTADRANIAEQLIRLEINFNNAPPGVSAQASTGSPSRPAISLAHSHH